MCAASPSHTSTSDGLSPPSSPTPLFSQVFDDVEFPEAYSPICYDMVDDDDDDGGNDDEDKEAAVCVPSPGTTEDKDSEHVSIHYISHKCSHPVCKLCSKLVALVCNHALERHSTMNQ
jgi:hypothetical protein